MGMTIPPSTSGMTSAPTATGSANGANGGQQAQHHKHHHHHKKHKAQQPSQAQAGATSQYCGQGPSDADSAQAALKAVTG